MTKELGGPDTKRPIVQALTIAGIIALYFAITAIPPPEGLSQEGLKAIALTICAIITWATQVIPILVSSVVFVFMTFFVGLTTEVEAVKNFASPTVFFMFASILMAVAMYQSGLNGRIALYASVLSKGKPKALILFMMLGTTIMSLFISNVPTFATFLPIVLALCEKNKCERGKSNFAKATIIGVIYSAMLGGNAMIGSTPINVMGVNMLKELTGEDLISFTQWTFFGFPIVFLTLPILWLIVVTVFPPEFKKLEGIDDAKKELAELGGLNKQEIKFIILIVAKIAIWFTDKHHGIPVTTATVFIAALYFFPGIELLKVDSLKKRLDWTIVIMTGTSIGLAAVMTSSGASKWLANIALMPFADSHPMILVLIIGVFCTLIMFVIPSCPASVAVIIPTIVAFSAETGIPVMLLFLPAAFNVAASWLLPFDPLPFMSFPEKYYSMKDYFKSGILAHTVLILVSSGVIMVVGKALNYF